MPSVVDGSVVMRQEVAPGHIRLGVRAPAIASDAAPGQFAMVQVSEGLHPFLRRPMSFERIFPDSVAFLFKIEGEGTRILSRFARGQTLSIQGPLGKGFRVSRENDRHILVGGGIGIAPLPALAEQIVRLRGRAPEVILAARTRDLLLCRTDFEQMGCTTHVATDDGSAGTKTLAHELLERVHPVPGNQVYACGPMPMLRAVAKLCMIIGVDCQVALEAQMACGDGACLGCVIESNSVREGERMLRVCKDGPVFDASIIDWDAHNFAYDR